MASSDGKSEGFKFTSEQMSSCEEAFATFDKHALGWINIRECGNAMRSIGQNPTDQELQDMCNEYVADTQGNIEFPEFMTMMGILFKNSDNEDEYKQAFRVFNGDDDDGFFYAHDLREILEKISERPSREEIEEILIHIDPDYDGKIWYEDFAHMMKVSPSTGGSQPEGVKSENGTTEVVPADEPVETTQLLEE